MARARSLSLPISLTARARIAELASGSVINCGPLSTKVQPVLIAQKVCAGVFPGVTTMELDDLAAETACYMSLSRSLSLTRFLADSLTL